MACLLSEWELLLSSVLGVRMDPLWNAQFILTVQSAVAKSWWGGAPGGSLRAMGAPSSP